MATQHVRLHVPPASPPLTPPPISPCQIYASSKYMRADMQPVMCPGVQLTSAGPISPSMLDAGHGPPGMLRRVDPFTMKGDEATKLALGWMM